MNKKNTNRHRLLVSNDLPVYNDKTNAQIDRSLIAMSRRINHDWKITAAESRQRISERFKKRQA